MREDRELHHGDDVTREQLVATEPRLAWLLAEVWAARRDDADEFEMEGVWGGSSRIGLPRWWAGIEGMAIRCSERRRHIERPITRS
jgi:hypothetical protein